MKVVCAWCQHRGWRMVLREIEPFDDPRETHGICGVHERLVMAQLRSTTAGRPGSPNAEPQPSDRPFPAGEIESVTDRTATWIDEGMVLLGRVLPDLLAEEERRGRAEAAERECDELRQRIHRLQQELNALRQENKTSGPCATTSRPT